MSNSRQIYVISTILTAALTLLLVGCGTLSKPRVSTTRNAQPASTAHTPTNPPFFNETNLEVMTPDPNFDPVSATTSLYKDVIVQTADGKKVQLDLTRQPVLFTAYWCPHCQRTLILLNKHRDELKGLPIVVSMGFAPGTTLKEAVHLEQAEEQALNLQHYQIYYDVNSGSAKLIPNGFPTLIFDRNGTLLSMTGEHTFSAWSKALEG